MSDPPTSVPPPDRAADPELLIPWLASVGWSGCRLEPLAGDVGARRYLRVLGRGGGSAVVALYPADLRSACRRFVATTALLDGAGVRVPTVLAADCGSGRMLVEDLGRETLDAWARRHPAPAVRRRFRAAAALVPRIAALDAGAVAALSPPLDGELMGLELTRTRETFLEPEGLETAGMDDALGALVEAVASVPRVPCHRDFMVRNLVPLGVGDGDGDGGGGGDGGNGDGGVAVLDHQDLRLGPPLYDLASLLNDTVFPPADLEAELLQPAGGGDVPPARRLEYHRVAAQRTLKAVGSYAHAARHGKVHHVERIGPTFERALAHLAAVPETGALAAELTGRWRQRRGRGTMEGPRPGPGALRRAGGQPSKKGGFGE